MCEPVLEPPRAVACVLGLSAAWRVWCVAGRFRTAEQPSGRGKGRDANLG